MKLIEEGHINYQDALKVASRPQGFRLMANRWASARPAKNQSTFRDIASGGETLHTLGERRSYQSTFL